VPFQPGGRAALAPSQQHVLAALHRWPGLTSSALAPALGLSPSTIGKMRADFRRSGLWAPWFDLDLRALGVDSVAVLGGLFAGPRAPRPSEAALSQVLAANRIPGVGVLGDGHLLLIALPRTLAGLVWTGLALLLTAHQARSPLWHQVETEVGGAVAGVEQEITLGPEALASLRSAGEAFLLFDLRVPRGDLSQALLQVGDTTLPGSRLLPTMPRLPESTSAGGRDWRGYPQWWALPLSAQLLPEDAARPLRVRLRRTGGPSLLLGGDRFRGQQVGYQGPGFGDWTKVVALKLEYDGDYRIPDQRPLGSRGTRSFLVHSDGQRTPVAFIHRIRLVTLADSQGGLHWETESAAAGKDPVFGFAAFSGGRGRAELRVADAVLDFPLGAREDFEVANGPFRLCHQAQGLRQDKALGVFLLSGPFQPGSPQSLEVRFKTGLSLERRFFVLDRRADVVSLTATARIHPS